MESIVIDYGLDPSGYMTGVGQVMAGNTSLQQSMAGVTTSSTLMQKALSVVTPTRALAAAFTGFAVTAASAQQRLHGLEATSTVTGVSVGKLAGGIKQLSRDFPIGSDGAAELITQFTKMGIAGQGSEKQILALSRSTAKLAGATGESTSSIAEGMVTLSRVTGNTNLNPKRFEALGDSLTTVSLKSGASASGILALSKNIAPMATAAGIGATGILGISSAFARLGEDGLGASTAVNKMLSDMNRSVRDGGPEIMKYATIVGKTTAEFTALFKANPTEAITQVTEALANAGSKGPRQLESIGLEGVRTQRILQGAMSTGGLRPGVQQAVDAYGSGSSAKASDAAYGSLNDSLGELQTASSDLASAFGTPLLSPLTSFTKGLTTATGFLTNIVGSDKGQNALKVVGGLVGAALLAKTVVGGAATLGLGRQMATSGGVRAFAAGWADDKGDPNSRMARFGGRASFLAHSQTDLWGKGGQLGHELDKQGQTIMERDSDKRSATYGDMVPKMRPLGQFERNNYFRGVAASAAIGPGDGGPSTLSKIATAGRAYGGNLITTYADSARKNLWNQTGARGTDPFSRENAWVPSKGFSDAGVAAKAAGGMLSSDGIKAFHTSLTGLDASTMKTSTVMMALAKTAGQAVVQTASLGASMTKLSAQGVWATGKAGVGAVANATSSGLGKVIGLAGGGAGIALMAGMAGVSQYQQEQARRTDVGKEWASHDINSTINTYREQAGQATKPQVTVGSMGADYAKSVANSAKTMEQAVKVSAEDMAAGNLTKDKIVQPFRGTNEQIAAQISGLSVTGLNTNDMQNAKVDLARQMPGNQAGVQAIMDLVAKSSASNPDEAPRKVTGSGSKEISKALAPWISTGLDAIPLETTGWRSLMQDTSGESGMAGLNKNVSRPDWLTAVDPGVGGGFHQSRLSEDNRKGLDAVLSMSDQRKGVQTKAMGANYGQQEQYKNWNTILADTAKSGDAESYLQLGKKMSLAVNQDANNKQGFDISPDLVKEKGGVAQALASLDPVFAKNYAGFTKEQKAAGGQFSGTELQSVDSQSLATSSPMMSKFFDYRDAKPGSSQALSAASAEVPDDLSKLDAAVKSMTNSVGDSAAALGDLQAQAAAAAAGLTPDSPGYQQAVAVEQRAGAKKEAAYKDMKPSEVMALEIPRMMKLVQNRDNTPTGDAQRRAGLEGLEGMKDQVRAQMTARVTAQRSADVSKGIAAEDYGTARQYQKDDYGVQVARTERDAQKARKRSIEDFNLSVKRSEQDYGVSRVRQVRDFNIQVKQAEQDALTQRMRAIRDFNTNVKREMEDAASQMFDPYSRIQTKPTWDSANMTANIEEQTAALVKQKKQLDELRSKGLSSQTIDQLGLGKAENAQQLDNIASDAMTDPSQVGKLNAAAKAKAAAAGDMTLDSSNKSLARGREDLAKSFADTDADLAKNLKRSRESLARNQSDQAADFAKNLARGNFDFKKSLARNAFDLSVALGDMAFQQNVSLDRQEKAFHLSMARIDKALLEADAGVGQDFKQLSESYNKAIHGTAVDWQKTMVTDSTKMVGVVSGTLVPELKKAWADGGLPLPAGLKTMTAGKSDPTGNNGGKLAAGGTVGGYSPHDKADNINIQATAGEYMQPVSTVKHYGVNAMEAIRSKKVPKELLNGYADGGLIAFGKSLQKKGFQVGEHPAFGGVTAGAHTPGSWHYRAGAIDVNHDQGNEKGAIDAIIASARAAAIRTIWQVTGHFDHAHFDIGKGGDMLGKGYAPGGVGGASAGTDSGSGDTGLSKAAIDAVMKKAPKGGMFYTHLMKGFDKQLRDTYQSKGATPSADLGGSTPTNSNAKLGQAMAKSLYKWSGPQWTALNKLWTGESGWNNTAQNPTSTAYGIAQFLDSTWSGYGGAKTSDAGKQIQYGLNYIAKRYGDPASALAKWQERAPHWYDQGGKLAPGTSLVHNGTGKPEAILNPRQWDLIEAMLNREQGKSLGTAAGVHMVVNHNENITYDNRNDFGDAKITVMSQDPDDMARQLEAKAVRGRVTQTRGVRAR